MDNQRGNFDPATGQLLNTTSQVPNNQNMQIQNNEQTLQTSQQSINQQTIKVIMPDSNIQNNLQSVPTVEQSKEQFINNTQSTIQEKRNKKKSDVNYTFVIILFVIILAAILFLFPFLLKYI